MSPKTPHRIGSSALILPSVEAEGRHSRPEFGEEQLSDWRHRLVVMLCLGVVAVVVWRISHGAAGPGPQPIWQGHLLQEWIEARDANMRYDESQDTHSPFTDCEIEEALTGIGPAALPFLRHWLISPPRRFTLFLNDLLDRQGWIEIRFRQDYPDDFLAIAGFQAYQASAGSLLPELIVLTHGRDVDLRSRAYEAAFLTLPDKGIFLSLAHDGLKESDPVIQAKSAWWMMRRYPEEAEKAGLRQLFPDLYQPVENVVDRTTKR